MRLNLKSGNLDWRNPGVYMRAVLGILLVANLVALYLLLVPPGGSLEEMEDRLVSLRQRNITQGRTLERMKALQAKVQESRAAGDKFFASYFMERRKAASTIVSELSTLAKQAGIRPKEHSFILEPVEGAEDLSMMTVNGSYEGTYADLIQFVYRVDRSPRFLIIESLTAAPQQSAGLLNISIRFHVFVKEIPGT
jgi:type IV pilus assembly protein PilO